MKTIKADRASVGTALAKLIAEYPHKVVELAHRFDEYAEAAVVVDGDLAFVGAFLDIDGEGGYKRTETVVPGLDFLTDTGENPDLGCYADAHYALMAEPGTPFEL